jgi:hypothetical protein
MSLIADWHLNLRHRSRFEPPLPKRVGRDFIKNCTTRALCHQRIGNPAARCIDQHNTDTVANSMGAPSFVLVLGKSGAKSRADTNQFT